MYGRSNLHQGLQHGVDRKAAKAVAAHEQRFAVLEGKIDTLRAEVKGEMAWTRWLMGTNIVLTLGVL